MATTEVQARPWDDKLLLPQLVCAVRELPRVPLDHVEAPTRPGIYLHFLALPSGPLATLLGPAADGKDVAYVGLASESIRARLRRYHQAFEGITALRLDQIFVAVMPCATRAAAVWAEAALIDELRPPLNGTGYGARPPGDGRPGRKRRGLRSGCSTWDALCPGRTWAFSPNAADIAVAELRLVEWQARRSSGGPRWPPLTMHEISCDTDPTRRPHMRPDGDGEANDG